MVAGQSLGSALGHSVHVYQVITLHIASYLGGTILFSDKVVKWYALALKANIYLINLIIGLI